MRPPDILYISQCPTAEHAVREMRSLLLMVLSFAVQCSQKEDVIERIQKMDECAQKGIVECIKEVTDNPQRVWKMEHTDLAVVDYPSAHGDGHRSGPLLIAHQHIKALVNDRDKLLKLVLLLWRENYQRKADGSGKKLMPGGIHHAAETADLRAQIRRLSQELYECGEEMKECKEELHRTMVTVDSLRKENAELSTNTRLVKVYRDELDIVYEKEKKAEKLESEVNRYRSQLNEMEYYKNRIEEMQQNLQLLSEAKALLETQLESARKRADLVPTLEVDVAQLKSQLCAAAADAASQREQVKDLVAENAQLTLDLQRYRTETELTKYGDDGHSDKSSGVGLSLSDQLTESLSTKVLRLEIENEKLRCLLESRDREHIPTHRSNSDYTDSDIGSGGSDSYDLCASQTNSLFHTMDSTLTYEESTVTGSTLCEYEPMTLDRHLISPNNKSVSKLHSYLEEENFLLKAEILSLKKSLEQYEKLEAKLTECHDERIETRKSLDGALSEILNLTGEMRQMEDSRAVLLEQAGEADVLRKENATLQLDLKSSDQKSKILERENKRLRQLVDSRSDEIAELRNQTAQLEGACKESQSEAELIGQLRSRMAELEAANMEMTQKLSICADSMNSLQNELVREKLRTRNSGKFVKEMLVFLNNQHVNVPTEVELDDGNGATVAGVVIDALSSALNQNEKDALKRENDDVKAELDNLRNDYHALWTAYEKEARRARTTPSSISIEASCTNGELQNDALEKLRMEAASLKQSLTVAKLKSLTFEDRLNTSQASYQSLQSDYQNLEKVKAQLEVESKSQQLTNSSLLKNLIQLEKEKDSLLKNAEDSQDAHSLVMADHEALQRLHEQLSQDYEKLTKELNMAKAENKKLVHDLAQSRPYSSMTQEGLRNNRMPDSADIREERLKRLEAEYAALVSENDALRNTNHELSETYRILTEEHKTVKTEINQLRLKKIEYEGVVYDCKSQVQSKEVEANRHTEILLGIIASLEDEKRSFAAAIERLVLQYDDVFLHSWREKSQMQTEQKELQEKLHALDLQKQLLIQKLYDTFKNADARKRHVGFLKRVRRAAGELVGRSRSRSRTRTISPTDSTADSSSVESTAGTTDRATVKRLHSISMHTMAALPKSASERNAAKSGPQLSYSSDDLRKNSSSASSCISPSEQPAEDGRPRTVSNGTSAADSAGNSRDPALHRIGSRRGVYQPNTNVVVHHPARERGNQLSEPTNPSKPQDAGDSSKPGAKKCCTSYGGFHDCSMLNYTRLTAATALANGASPSTLRRNNEVRASSEMRESKDDRASSGSNVSTPTTSVRSAHLYAVPHQQRLKHLVSTTTSRSSPKPGLGTPPNGYVFRPRSSIAASDTATQGEESDTISTWSFNGSQSGHVQSGSYERPSYYRSDASTPSVIMESQPRDLGSSVGNVEDSPVWYEYGCV
ncbi:girdin-like isoform X2 [Paramacrobiotus metropolitanus]|nr:girdin-like isoform X2 [Paramacrobiotus metropolitanus]